MSKGILIRVGIDTSTGGLLGPIFDDGSFEFIPFRLKIVDEKSKYCYNNIKSRTKGFLADFSFQHLIKRKSNILW